MLDPEISDSAREELAESARSRINESGNLLHENNWGVRKMAYEINRKSESDYRWFRFEADNELLGSLDHSLKIADGVVRFRIFKVDPDAPVLDAPPQTAAVMAARGEDDDDRRSRGRFDSDSGSDE